MRKLLFLLILFLAGFVCSSQTISIIFSGKEIQYDSLVNAAELLKSQLEKSGYKVTTHNDEKSVSTNIIDISVNEATQTKQLKNSGAEGFSLFCNGRKVSITATSVLGIRNGIFMYLETLGYRYYFPNPAWYIIPQKPNLFKPLNKVSSPGFLHRKIWYGYGTTASEKGDSAYKFWFMANRLGGAMQAVVGESYSDIVYRHKQTFQQHPEWFYPVVAKGVIPPNPKFDLANETVVDFVIKDVLDRLEEAKQRKTSLRMISLCPSDGGGTCNTPACQRLGTVTDRVYSLINKAARIVNQKYPGTWISGMAYADYSAPPTRKLEPNTFVSVATAFNYTKYSTDELIKEWGIKAGMVGVYDYLGLYVWDFDLPGKGHGARVNQVSANIKKYYKLGARTYDAESTPGSINKGLGHYIAARLLWDVNENAEVIKNEFFKNCFDKAAPLMQTLWKIWETYPYDMVRESDLAEWIDLVKQAEQLEQRKDITERFAHIKMYLHYLFLFNNFKRTSAEPELVELLTYCYNTTETGALAGNPALWQLGNTSTIPGLQYRDPAAKYRKDNPLLRQIGYTEQLIAQDRRKLLRKDNMPVMGTARFLKKINAPMPAAYTEKKYEGVKGMTVFRGNQSFVCKVVTPGKINYLKFSGGLVAGGSERAILISVFPYSNSGAGSSKPLLQYNYTGTRDTQQISLEKLPKGDYLIKVDDPGKMFRINFSPSVYYSAIANANDRFSGYTMYMWFYVPKEKTKFRIFKEIEVKLISPTGRIIDKTKKGNEEVDIGVMPGEEGIWYINFLNGRFHIEGVPPFLGLDPSRMIIAE